MDLRHEQAERWLDAELNGRPVPPVLAVIGLGDGALLDVIGRRAPDTRVLAIEPDRAAALPDEVAPWRESGRLIYLRDPDYAGADQAWRLFPSATDYTLLVHPSVARDSDSAVRAAKTFKQIVFGVSANAEARRRFAPRYLTNTIRNIPAIVAGRDVRDLSDAYRGMPAVIAAAGPSLDNAIDDLWELSDRAVIIAADTALRPLLAGGVHPQLAVAVDPGWANARHFHSLPSCPRTFLVAEGAIDPSSLAPFESRTFWFRAAHHHPWPWLNEHGLDVGPLDVWGSVLSAAFQTAVLAGCDPIVFVGADLAFTGQRPYCRGTTYEHDWATVVESGRTIEDAWRDQMALHEQIVTPDLDGNETITSAPLQSFRSWLVARANGCGRRVVNATSAGTLFGAGIEQRPLRRVLGSPVAVPSLETRAVQLSTVKTLSIALKRTLPIDTWRAFSGDGYQDADVTGAIDDAIAGLSSFAREATATASRNLTREGAPKSVSVHATADGVVCASLLGHDSVLIREDGSMAPHLSWPRFINGALPLGANGTVAWSVGEARWPDGGRGAVMYRSADDADVVVEDLPFGPSAGIWHDGRLYWTCYPFGVGTWAPGERPVFALPDLTLYGIESRGRDLILHPRVRGVTGATERRFSSSAWRWTPGQPLEAVDLGEHGPQSSTVTNSTWTATAYPEADLITLASSSRTVELTCEYPFSLAWAGRSLVVCTAQGDVLLFERLLDRLEGAR